MYSTHMSSREVIQRLLADGWILDRIRGDHHVYRHANRPLLAVVAHPTKDIPVGTLRSIFRQAGWDWKARR